LADAIPRKDSAGAVDVLLVLGLLVVLVLLG